MAPVICMVTDRRRAGGEQALVDRVAAAVRAGVHLVQVREPDMEARALTALVGRCVEAARGTRARVLVNDRVDVALAAGADGVHLKATSSAAPRVRTMVPAGFLIGRSVHSREEIEHATEAGGLDFLVYGTVFETGSKPGRVPIGLGALRVAVASTPLPVLAIGGMTLATLSGVGSTGAAGFAAIGLFADPPPAEVQLSVQRASRAFDTPLTVP